MFTHERMMNAIFSYSSAPIVHFSRPCRSYFPGVIQGRGPQGGRVPTLALVVALCWPACDFLPHREIELLWHLARSCRSDQLRKWSWQSIWRNETVHSPPLQAGSCKRDRSRMRPHKLPFVSEAAHSFGLKDQPPNFTRSTAARIRSPRPRSKKPVLFNWV